MKYDEKIKGDLTMKLKNEAIEEVLVQEENITAAGSVVNKAPLTEAEIIAELKLSNPILCKNVVDGQSVIWKPMNRAVHREALKIGKDDDTLSAKEVSSMREEFIAKSCILYPSMEILETLIEEKAGFAIVITDEIFQKSGFDISVTEEL